MADATSINLTKITGGVQTNNGSILKSGNQWCKNVGEGVCVKFDHKQSPVTPTKLGNSNIYWVAFKETTDKLWRKLKTEICGGATDDRYI
ncbi:hypothetical protein Zmor_026417 [Zophobas morio]|uniref:Uncharacterized protein n=1 Tax=Zophobas morio TaxID=2755281 RepID=A0AA38HTS8_9CUCU|nr:hypothetical protein Zmor_026417 [Zophobas morio]